MKRLFFIISLLLCLPLAAQRSDFMRKEALMPLVERLTAFGKKIPQEKVYVHMDNTCYFQGDTIWFAAYTRQTTARGAHGLSPHALLEPEPETGCRGSRTRYLI